MTQTAALVFAPLELPSGDPLSAARGFGVAARAAKGVAPAGIQLAGPHAVLRRGANALALPPSTGRAIEGREHEGALVARELWRLP